MRSQSYGDKQREAQKRKQQEELWKKSHPQNATESATDNEPPALDKSKPERAKAKDKSPRRSA